LTTLATGPLAPITGGLQAAETSFQASTEKGVTGVKRGLAALGEGATAAITEKLLGVPAMLKSVKTAAKVPIETLRGKVMSVLKESAKGFGRESLQEMSEELIQNFIAQKLYDPERQIFDKEQLLTVGLAGGILGGGVSGTLRSITPEAIAPKTEMQDAAQSVDESLAQLASETPPTETFIPQEQVPQGPTVTPSENAVQGPPVTAEEGVPVTSEFVSTAINTPSGIVTGPEQGTAHPNMMEAFDKGLEDADAEKNLGFAFTTPEGTQWVDRVEAGRRLTQSGQLQGLSEGTPLTSEHIRNEVEGVTFSPEPQPKTKDVVPPKAQTQEEVAKKTADELQQYQKEAIEVARQAGATDPQTAFSIAQETLAKQGNT